MGPSGQKTETYQCKWMNGNRPKKLMVVFSDRRILSDFGFLLVLAAKLLQSCPTLCDPIDGSPPGSPVRGILQARILEVGCHALLQGIFPTQGSNSGLLHCRQISLPAEPPGKPEWLLEAIKNEDPGERSQPADTLSYPSDPCVWPTELYCSKLVV